MDWIKRTDKQIIEHALHMWANWIESGNPSLSVKDVLDMGGNPNSLNKDQQCLCNRLRKMAEARK